MKERELLRIAKTIRNMKGPQGFKDDFAEAIAEAMVEEDQFFNSKKFLTLAKDVLPEGWPNRMDNV